MERKIPILVIDDEPGNLEIISEYLEDQDYAITTALDGESALHLITESSIPFQAVLLDWMMPGVDGLEVYVISRLLCKQRVPAMMIF